MKIVLSILLVFLSIFATAQEGSLVIHQSDEIAKLLEKHKKVNEIHPYTNGYRVQLFSVGGANSKEKANSHRNDFLALYPESQIYVIYQAPYFKVRLGNFRTQLEALAYLQLIKLSYPFAFVVIDEIEIPKSQ